MGLTPPASVYDYLKLITSEHNQKPKFMAMLQALVQPFVDQQNVLWNLPNYFDVDLATGNQLDIIGQWVGVTRTINQALQVEFGISELPDSQYRILLKLFIAQNFWDGNVPGIYEIWNTVFGPIYGILVSDLQDMTMFITFLTPPTDLLTQAILTQGYFKLVPAGVLLLGFFMPSLPWEPDEVGPNFQNPQDLVGTVDGINKAFTIPVTPGFNFAIVEGGTVLEPGVDYVVDGTAVEFTVAPTVTPIAFVSDSTPVFGFGAENSTIAGWGVGAWVTPI